MFESGLDRFCLNPYLTIHVLIYFDLIAFAVPFVEKQKQSIQFGKP